jgi:hypothetical protein
MTNPDLRDAYFAGLIDGEGYIHLAPKRGSFRQHVKVNMTCEKTVLAIRDHFKVGKVRPRKKEKPHHKDQWLWQVYYYDARMVLTRILPFLITKRGDAEKVLEYVPRRRGGPRKQTAP